ncbi:MAG: hypothetical protein ACR2FH_11570 [Caulobacteraceae bacterium]
MNPRILFAAIGAASLAAASVAAQTSPYLSPEDQAKAEHNQTQTPTTVPTNRPGSPRVGAAATAPLVDNGGPTDRGAFQDDGYGPSSSGPAGPRPDEGDSSNLPPL